MDEINACLKYSTLRRHVQIVTVDYEFVCFRFKTINHSRGFFGHWKEQLPIYEKIQISFSDNFCNLVTSKKYFLILKLIIGITAVLVNELSLPPRINMSINLIILYIPTFKVRKLYINRKTPLWK